MPDNLLARELLLFWRRRRLHESDELVAPGEPLDQDLQAGHDKIVFDPQHPGFVKDPYPFFEYLREHEPVQRGATGAWVLSRYQDIADALVDARLGNAPSAYATVNRRNSNQYLCARVANNTLPFLDPPQHNAPRKLITHSFNQYIRRHPPPLETLARDLLDQLDECDAFDLMRDYATPYAAQVFRHLLDLDNERLPELMEWSHWFFYLLTVIPSQQARIQIDVALERLRSEFGELVAARRAAPGNDFVSYLLATDGVEEALGEELLIDNLILLFADGVGNVDKGICNAAALLIQHPDQLARLRADPGLLGAAMDECLRFESPGQFIGRVATETLEIGGVSIRKNDAVLLLLGSANRDPAQFEHADRFDIARFPNPHLAFGKSRHACVGAPLVRLEMQAALRLLFDAFDDLELANHELNWQLRVGHRWLQELPVVRHRAGQ